MKIAAGTPIDVSLRWDLDDVQIVGRIAYRDRVAYLEYDQRFLDSGINISPVHYRTEGGLHPSFDVKVFEGLHGVFHDSLPDGWGRLLVDRRARQLGIEPATLSPLDRLACVGSNGIGALSYTPAIDVWGDEAAVLDLDGLATDAQLVLSGDVSEVLLILGRNGGSPGGARPKALIAVNEEGHAVHGIGVAPMGYEHYLVKFPGRDDPDDIAAIEMAYSMMAKDAGLIMPETRLLSGQRDQVYFAAKRFDKIGNKRVHVHSASGLLYTDIRIPQLDYKDLILLTRSVTRDQRECKKMFTLAVFNVLSHNRDDHARQFSYIMQRDGQWHMSPVYDLTWCVGPGGEHSTTVLGHGKDITRQHLMELGKKADLNEQSIREILEQVESAIGSWSEYAAEFGVSHKSNNLIMFDLQKVRI